MLQLFPGNNNQPLVDILASRFLRVKTISACFSVFFKPHTHT